MVHKLTIMKIEKVEFYTKTNTICFVDTLIYYCKLGCIMYDHVSDVFLQNKHIINSNNVLLNIRCLLYE